MDIILIHGAWQGAWCWERVVPLLEPNGHRVTAPTLTGSGARSAEASPAVTLDVHAGDVITVIDDLPDDSSAVLVGHSYGGMVIAEVAEQRADRISAVLYLDAFCPEDGESAFTFIPDEFQQWFRQLATEQGDGWRLPATEQLLDLWGLHDEADRSWAWPRLTDWSLPCFEAATRAPNRRFASIPRTYAVATAEDYPLRPLFEPIAERMAAEGCEVVEVPSGHEIMIQEPHAVADLINRVAS